MATHLVRLAVVAVLATFLTIATPVSAGDKPTNTLEQRRWDAGVDAISTLLDRLD